MTKSNIRSFRYSDKVGDVLEKFQGASMNDKFENLVLFCFDHVEARKQEIKRLDDEIAKRQKEYAKICDKMRDVSSLVDTLKTIESYGNMALKKAESIANM